MTMLCCFVCIYLVKFFEEISINIMSTTYRECIEHTAWWWSTIHSAANRDWWITEREEYGGSAKILSTSGLLTGAQYNKTKRSYLLTTDRRDERTKDCIISRPTVVEHQYSLPMTSTDARTHARTRAPHRNAALPDLHRLSRDVKARDSCLFRRWPPGAARARILLPHLSPNSVVVGRADGLWVIID